MPNLLTCQDFEQEKLEDPALNKKLEPTRMDAIPTRAVL